MQSTAVHFFQHLSAIRKVSRKCEEIAKMYDRGENPHSTEIEAFRHELQQIGIVFLSNLPAALDVLEDEIFAKLSEAESELARCIPTSHADALALMDYALLRLKDGVIDHKTIALIEDSLGLLKTDASVA